MIPPNGTRVGPDGSPHARTGMRYGGEAMNVHRVPIDDPAWAAFVTTHQAATAFHLPQWAMLIADCYGFEPHVLTLEDHEGALIGGLPLLAVRSPFGARRWVSLPFTDHCPLLVHADAQLDEVVATLAEYVRANPVAELEVRSALAAAGGVHPVVRGYHHSLALPQNPDDLHPHKAHRNNRNRAQRNGVTVTRDSSRDAARHDPSRTRRPRAAFAVLRPDRR
jgi:hypothetical protein